MDIEKREATVLLSLFLVSVGAGFFMAGQTQQNSALSFEKFVDYRAGPEKAIKKAEFDNRSLNLMYEDSEAARMYIDLDRDGSFDRKLNTTNDGEKRLTEEVVTLKNRSYRLYFRYRDDSERSGDGFLTLYRIKQIL